MKEIYKYLEAGDIKQEGDEVFINSRWKKTNSVGGTILPLEVLVYPFRRKVIVTELPPIPAGFRPVTREDVEKKRKGEIKRTSFSSGGEYTKIVVNNVCPYHFNNSSYHYIINEKRKFKAEDIKKGMKFRPKAGVEAASISNGIICFYQPIAAELNDNY